MKPPIMLVGVGEMGGVFARGLLRSGHPVFPVTRTMRMKALAAAPRRDWPELWRTANASDRSCQPCATCTNRPAEVL